MGVRSTLQLPKEHGSWGMFLIPLLLGLIAGQRFSTSSLLLVLSAAAAFLTREPFTAWWRAWRRGTDPGAARRMALLYGGASVLIGAPLLLSYPWLALLGAAGAIVFCTGAELAMRGEGRKAAPELLAIATSMLLAPAAYYVGTGRLDRTALLLWLLCFGYFGSSVFYVKMRVAAARARTPEAQAGSRRQCLLYHVALTALLALSVWQGLPVVALAAFLPILARAFYYVARPTAKLSLKQVGWTEVVYSLWFVACLSGALIPLLRV